MTKLVEVRKLRKEYSSGGNTCTALADIDLTIHKGEFTSIMGPSGSGKSTLLHLLSTIDHPTSGEIVMDGTNLRQLKEEQLVSFRRHKLGFIFQDYNLLDTLTVRENIALPLALAKRDVPEVDHRVEDVARKYNLHPLLENYPFQLSGGQKQRTAAARATVIKPSLILADEPTGALDTKSATGLLEILRNLNVQEGATILMVTHDPRAASYSQRVVLIQDGQLYRELLKGNETQQEFHLRVHEEAAQLGGNVRDAI